jgi:hypothetical protein
MKSATEVFVWAWSADKGNERIAFPNATEAWGFCADHPNDWIRIEQVETTVIFDKQDPLGLDLGQPEPIIKKGNHGSERS